MKTLTGSVLACALAAVTTHAATAQAQKPYLQPDDTWMSLSGRVAAVSADAFMLDYGDGLVTVEMDDGDRDADGYKLLEGDRVTVNGVIDDDFFETTTIEASSVYVEKLNTYFFASAVDEEAPPVPASAWYDVAVMPEQVVLKGTVSSVDRPMSEFTLDTGGRQLTVELERLPYDPLDDEGYQQIGTGDRVRVAGVMDNDLFDGRVLDATSIVSLEE